MIELLRTNDLVTISAAQAFLKAEGIDSFVMDQNMSVMEGSIGIFPRRLMVVDEDVRLSVTCLVSAHASFEEELNPKLMRQYGNRSTP